MKSEITKAAFFALVPIDAKAESSTDFEHSRDTTWHVHGITVTQVENFVSCVTQFYVTDINA